MNLVILSGRIGNDPEFKVTESGTAFCRFSLAVKRKYSKDENGEQKEPHWFRITCWRKTAELVAEHKKKGDEVTITGYLDPQSWEKDGTTQYETKIMANEVTFHGGKSRSEEDPY